MLEASTLALLACAAAGPDRARALGRGAAWKTGLPSLSTHILLDEYSHDPHFGWLVHMLQQSWMLGTFGNALPWSILLHFSPACAVSPWLCGVARPWAVFAAVCGHSRST